jgi:hypothetical protein
MMDDFDTLLARLRDCTIRAADLALGPSSGHAQHAGRETAVDQPGPATRAHESGVPWNDPSGAPLRDWLQIPPTISTTNSRSPSCPWVSAIRVPMRKAVINRPAPNARPNGTRRPLPVYRMSS